MNGSVALPSGGRDLSSRIHVLKATLAFSFRRARRDIEMNSIATRLSHREHWRAAMSTPSKAMFALASIVCSPTHCTGCKTGGGCLKLFPFQIRGRAGTKILRAGLRPLRPLKVNLGRGLDLKEQDTKGPPRTDQGRCSEFPGGERGSPECRMTLRWEP